MEAATTTGPLSSSSTLRARADDLRRLAGRIRSLDVLELHHFCTTATWVGPSQQRFERDLRDAAVRLRRTADELVHTAGVLDRRAEDLGRLGLPDMGGVR